MPQSTKGLQGAQEQWLRNLLDSDSHCDAVVLVGPEASRISVHRILLANISEPLATMFYGEFREGVMREVSFPQMEVGVFRCIQQASVGLDPGINAEIVVPTLLAAEQYMISALATECSRYMNKDVVGASDILTVMTSSLKHGYSLPEDTERAYWSTCVADSNSVLQSPAFLLADHRIIQKLVQLDEFGVAEDLLWSRLVEWAAGTEQKPELVSSLLCNESEGQEKQRCHGDKSLEPAKPSSHKHLVLREFIQHLRFPLMSKTLFVDEATMYLSPEEERSVTTFYLLGRKSQFSTSERICGPSACDLPIRILGSDDAHVFNLKSLLQGAASLLQGTATWPLVCSWDKYKHNQLFFELPEDHPSMIVSEVQFTFCGGATDSACGREFHLHALDGKPTTTTTTATTTTITTTTSAVKASGRCVALESVQAVQLPPLPPARKWQLEFASLHDPSAKLAKLCLKGQASQGDWANSVVNSRAFQLLSNNKQQEQQ
ncbi:unnamed protein product [Polarella glacialis]|uniref:BTB domain-containing protein n=1 Tax=Polarella glacialis TaxID=89957 RepID=A0A813HWV0_POLGL|nr:unnamed protein product [Polarella glacialis]CAE8618660.1 unnamed protein product [Polarella glacialis]CAE8642634.1 unnamed protein product [Polarella glacialis]